MFILFPFKSFQVHLNSFMFISYPSVFILCPFKSFHVHLISFTFISSPFKSFHVIHVHFLSFQVLACSSQFSSCFLSSPFMFISILSCSSHILWFSSYVLSSPFMFISFLSRSSHLLSSPFMLFMFTFFPFKSLHVHLSFHRVSFQVLSCSSHVLSSFFIFISLPFMLIALPCCKYVVQ